ncbi:FKBP-type peptidyl-prolyl cis-trans isomerase [Halobacterium litoreum]|uniref:Peptidyl-prolyl cis-trans isomerase n=1 Tax=Halobacterium litoreum TaxID=2039234 RepID=A0ABD5NH96_9EURY|nr:FKBP-type peptidyl-prolyl cis-trans isomerase [Halobacterium litoreum]UHH12551.1 FKBP-type peptidyl-prolyl cis-trans isomerase [Halobacterium litoreum]
MVSTGDRAVVHYVARLAGEDAGAVVDTTDVDVALAEDAYYGRRDYEPLVFEVGAGEVLAPIEDAVRQMDAGETREIEVDAGDVFGARSDERVVSVPREDLEARSDTDAAEGELVASEDGQTGWITDVGEERVEIDFNHELADERLSFEVRLLDVNPDENDGVGGGEEASGGDETEA